MKTDDFIFAAFGLISIMFAAMLLVFGIVGGIHIIFNNAANEFSTAPTFSIFDSTATFTVAVIAASLVIFSSLFNYLNHREQIRISCRVKQLEELYYPLKTALDYNHKIDIERLERYSYLATGKLEPLITSFIKTQKSLSGNSNPLDNVVSKAIEHDIPEIQKDLKDHLRIKEPVPKTCP